MQTGVPFVGGQHLTNPRVLLLFDPATPLLGAHPEDMPLSTQNTEA